MLIFQSKCFMNNSWERGKTNSGSITEYIETGSTGMLRVILYQVCLDNAPGVKTHPGSHKFEHKNKDGKFQNSSLKLKGRELLIFSV